MFTVVVGVAMLVVFMALILSKKVSALTALIVVPVVFGFIAGYGTSALEYAVLGMVDEEIGQTVAMLAFAILYFGIMLNTGLFDPLAGLVTKYMKGDPFRVIMGTTIMSTLVSLDGDGTTTVMICCAALIPVYTKLNINKVYLAAFIIMPNGVINFLPWGGPTARLLAVLPMDSNALLIRLLPMMGIGLLAVYIVAFYVGIKLRRELGVAAVDVEGGKVRLTGEDLELRRPKLIWFNLGLTVVCMVAIIGVGIPGPLVFAIAACIALTVNYHDIKLERKVIERNAEGIVTVCVMIMGAGVLMGMLSRSGMAEQMATALISVIPESWSGVFGLIIAIISGPAVWILNNDAFYFGIVPVLAETAQAYGFTDMQIGLATLIGQMLRGCSPVIASLYFMCSYLKIEFSDFQRKMIPISVFAFAFFLVGGAFLGIYTPA